MIRRLPQYAGSFYPEDRKELMEMLDFFFKEVAPINIDHRPRALIVPHAGYIYSGQTAAYGYKAIKDFSYKRIIILGPSHHFYFKGLASCPPSIWETPLGKSEARDLNELLEHQILVSEAAHFEEHSLEVQLPFLQYLGHKFILYPALIGEASYEDITRILEPAIDENTLLIISSDLSHYLKEADARRQDKITLDALLDNDIESFWKVGDACGKIGIAALMKISLKRKWQPQLLFYTTSAQVSANKEAVVGYASVLYQ